MKLAFQVLLTHGALSTLLHTALVTSTNLVREKEGDEMISRLCTLRSPCATFSTQYDSKPLPRHYADTGTGMTFSSFSPSHNEPTLYRRAPDPWI